MKSPLFCVIGVLFIIGTVLCALAPALNNAVYLFIGFLMFGLGAAVMFSTAYARELMKGYPNLDKMSDREVRELRREKAREWKI